MSVPHTNNTVQPQATVDTNQALADLMEEKNKKGLSPFLKKTNKSPVKPKTVQDSVQGDRSQFAANTSDKQDILPMVLISGLIFVIVAYMFLKPSDETNQKPLEKDLVQMSSEQDAKRDLNKVNSVDDNTKKASFQAQLEEAERTRLLQQPQQQNQTIIPAPDGLNGSESNSSGSDGGIFDMFKTGKTLGNPYDSRLSSSAVLVGGGGNILPNLFDSPDDSEETSSSKNNRGTGGNATKILPPKPSNSSEGPDDNNDGKTKAGGGFLGSNSPFGQALSGLTGATNSGSFGGVNLSAPNLPAAKASRIGNRNYLITKGTKIDCVIENEIDTTIPGMITCIVAHNVYNETGRIVLIDRGSQVIGQFSGGASLNQPKVSITWNRLKSPKGIVIDLDSPTTNRLGVSGFDGVVDKRFWDRFGGSVMFSLLDIAPSLLGINGGGAFISTANNQIKTASQIALENTIGIQPVIRAMQGSVIKIFMGRDLDFSDVYDIAPADKNKKYFK